MADKTLAELAEKMRDIDFAMLSTHTHGGAIGARPMSNNRDVDYDGSSHYFTMDGTLMVQDIAANPQVGLSFLGTSGMPGQWPFFVAVEGRAELIHDKAQFVAHWTPDLDRWFADGIHTAGLVLLKVHASRIRYWDGEDDGEILI